MKKAIKIIVTLLFAIYLAMLLRLTVFRNNCFSHGLFSGRVEWPPLVYLWQLVCKGKIKYFTYLFAGNIGWFVPLGIYLRWLRKPFWQAVAAGFCLSLLIEVSQFVLGCGVSEIDDLVLNTCGAMLGYGLAAPLFKNKKA